MLSELVISFIKKDNKPPRTIFGKNMEPVVLLNTEDTGVYIHKITQ